MATVLSPDAKFLALLGPNVMLNVDNLIVAALFYGVYTILFFVAVVILSRREGKCRARIGLLFAILTLFTLSSFWFWGNVDLFMVVIRSDLVNDVGQPLSPKHVAYTIKFHELISSVQIIIPIMLIIGDSIVFWRAWVLLCDVNRKIVLVPLVFLLGTIACSFGFVGCMVQNNLPIVNPDSCNNLEIAAFSLSIVTNITGTLVIGYRFWLYRQAVGKYLGGCRYTTRVEKIFVVLIETGSAYSILWIVELILVLIPPPPTFAGEVTQQIFVATCVQLMGIYPTLLVVLVYFQRSLWDTQEVSMSTTLQTSSAPSIPPKTEDFNFRSNSTLVGNGKSMSL